MHRQKPFSDFCDPMESIRQGNNAALQAIQKRPTSHKYSRDERKDYADEGTYTLNNMLMFFFVYFNMASHTRVYLLYDALAKIFANDD